MSGPGVWAVPQLWWSSCVGMLNTGDTSQLTFFFKINELFSVSVNYSVFVLGTSSFDREEHGDQKLNDLKVNQESLVYVPVPVETAPAYLPGLHQMEFTSCDHLKIKKAVVLMSFMTILLRSLF